MNIDKQPVPYYYAAEILILDCHAPARGILQPPSKTTLSATAARNNPPALDTWRTKLVIAVGKGACAL